MKRLLLLIGFLIATHAITLAQQTGSALRYMGNIGYVAPNGWKLVTSSAQMHAFLSPGATESRQALLIIASLPLSGALKDAFNRQVSSSIGTSTIVSSSPLKEQKTQEGFDLLLQSFTVETNTGQKLYSVYVGAAVNGVLLMISLAANDGSVFTGSQADFTNFLTSVKLPKPETGNKAATVNPQQVPATDPAAVQKSELARRRPNTVSGNVYDAQGRPFRIPGAKVVVHIWGAGSNGDRAGFNIPVDANGHYESAVPSGLYGFHARAYLPLNGNLVCQDLEPLDGQPTEQAVHSAPGIVKDFALRLTGLMAGGNAATIQGYYGGKITITDGDDWKNPYFGSLTKTYPAGSKVVVTLVPQTPLIDGSRGQTMSLECPIEKMSGGGVHKANIPLAAYRVSARLVTPDGRERSMRVAALPSGQFADFLTIYYEPDTGDPDGHPIVPNILVASN